MAQRMLAQWQQHSAEETIYIILCAQACLCDWDWIKERQWEKGEFCVWASLCAVSFSHTKTLLIVIPHCCTCHPSPNLFFYTVLPAGLSHGGPAFLFGEAPWPSQSPFSFILPLGHRQHNVNVIYFPARLWNKKTLFESQSLMKRVVLYLLISLIREFQNKLIFCFFQILKAFFSKKDLICWKLVISVLLQQ